MYETVIKFGDSEIKKEKVHLYESPISIKDIDINKIVVSKNVCFGKNIFYWLQK